MSLVEIMCGRKQIFVFEYLTSLTCFFFVNLSEFLWIYPTLLPRLLLNAFAMIFLEKENYYITLSVMS